MYNKNNQKNTILDCNYTNIFLLVVLDNDIKKQKNITIMLFQMD